MKSGADHDSYCIPAEGLMSGVTTRHLALEGLCDLLGLSQFPLVRMNQTHSTQVRFIRHRPEAKETVVAETDGIFTCQKGVVLAVRTADCLPLLVYHPQGLVGAVHVGRKGSQDGILGFLFSEMYRETGWMSGFTFFLGPCICKACYQIDRISDLHYGLIEETRDQIQRLWPGSSILESGACTSCQVDRYFSYRKEQGTQDRIFSVISMV